MTRYCPNCGERVMEGDAFCGECGTRLGTDDRQDTDWSEEDAGWDEQDIGRGGQDAGWSEGDTGRGGSQPGAQGHGTRGSGPHVPRKGALETFTQGLKWIIGLPVLLGAFLVVDLVNVVGETVNPLFSLLGFLLSLVVWGVAYRYAERLLADEPVEGSVDELFDTASDVLGRLLSLVGIFIVYVIVVGIGFLLFILPGIYLGARLILAYPACVLDDQRAFQSLSTSWDVAHGNVLKLVGIFLINVAVVFGVFFVAAIIGGIAALDSPVFLALTAPVTAVFTGAVQMAVGRVYLENREGGGMFASSQPGSQRINETR